MAPSANDVLRSYVPATLYAGAVVAAFGALIAHPGPYAGAVAIAGRPGTAWLTVVLLTPIAIGLILQLAGRRFWAWPFVYLVAVFLFPKGPPGDPVDQAYQCAVALTIITTIAVAEALGLSLGRWLHRAVGVAYFAGGAVWLLAQGLYRVGRPDFAADQAWTLGLAGVLFLVQSVLQLVNYLSVATAGEAAAMQDGTEEDDRGALEPPAVVEGKPWRVRLTREGGGRGTEAQANDVPSASEASGETPGSEV